MRTLGNIYFFEVCNYKKDFFVNYSKKHRLAIDYK